VLRWWDVVLCMYVVQPLDEMLYTLARHICMLVVIPHRHLCLVLN
jgi:hypothetical protein